MILALETATNVCSVAFDNGESVFERRVVRRGSHSEKLFLFIEELQKEHHFSVPELDAVLVSEGPGSYTGLRIGASAVKGLLFHTGVELFGMNTLASFAKAATEKHPETQTIHSIIDARRVHVYHQKFSFRDGDLHSGDKVEVIPIEAFENMVRKGDVIIGTGLDRISEEVLEKTRPLGPGAVTAKSLLSLYKEGLDPFYTKMDPESFEPKYHTSRQVG